MNKIGAAVDAGLVLLKMLRMKILIFLLFITVFSGPPTPLTGPNYQKIKNCIEKNLAVYGAHLPLDCHRNWK